MPIIMKKVLAALFAVALGLNLSAQVPDYVPTDGLVAWYPFNGNANDESGNGNDGVIHGASASDDRLGSTNPHFIRWLDDYLSVSNDFNFEELTLSVWIKQHPTSEHLRHNR